MTSNEFCQIMEQEGYELRKAGGYIEVYSTELNRYVGFALLDSYDMDTVKYVQLNPPCEKSLHTRLTIYGVPM